MSAHKSRFSHNGDGKSPENNPADERQQQVVEALGKRYKQLNALWEAAEASLKKIPIPLDVPLLLKSYDADPARPGEQIRTYLGFVRSKGGWRICYCTEHDGFPQYDNDWKPITECSVDIRLEAVPRIGELRELVLKKAEECVPTLDKAIEDLRNTLENW
jgi:hypothetical protein